MAQVGVFKFFEYESMLCCVACELLVSVVFYFHSSPPVFFLKPSSLLGSASLNGKRIGKDKGIPLTETQEKKKKSVVFFVLFFFLFINLGQFGP